MTFEQLRVFIAVAEHLSFTRAAEQLYLSQPAVSQHIQSLERGFQVPLFERKGRRFELSQAGETLLGYAHRIMREAAEATTALQELTQAVHGKLQLGTTETIGSYLLPEIIGRFSREYPQVQVSMRMKGALEVISSLASGDMDLAIVEEPFGSKHHDQVVAHPFLSGEVVVIVAPQHPLADRTEVPPEALKEMPLIVRHSGDRTRVFWSERLAEVGIHGDQLHVAFELDNTEGIKRAVMANLGAGFVSVYAVERELSLGMLRTLRLSGVNLKRAIWALTPVRHQQPMRVQAFLDYLKTFEPPIVRPRSSAD